MATDVWITVAILLGSILGLSIFFIILSSRKVDTLKKTTNPEPVQVMYGPKAATDEPDSGMGRIEKSRGTETGVIPLIVKTVVGFYDTIYIGESYTCKIFIFNNAKNADSQEKSIDTIMKKELQKKFTTDTLYGKEQEPAKIKLEIFAPNFNISPSSRTLEIPAGGVATSTHVIAPLTDIKTTVLGKKQIILVSFNQVLGEAGATEEIHLGSIDYSVQIEKAAIPVQIESEIKTQEKIKYVSTAAGAVAAIITAVATALAVLGI
jgi:hypothetical protein